MVRVRVQLGKYVLGVPVKNKSYVLENLEAFCADFLQVCLLCIVTDLLPLRIQYSLACTSYLVLRTTSRIPVITQRGTEDICMDSDSLMESRFYSLNPLSY